MKNIAYGFLIVICLGGISFAEVPTHGWRYLSKEKCKLLYSEGTKDYVMSRSRERIDPLRTYSKTRAAEILARYSIRHPSAVEEGAYCFEGGYKDEQSGRNVRGGERFYDEFWRIQRPR